MKEVNPKETSRASAFEMWMSSPMSMVTSTKFLQYLQKEIDNIQI